MWNLRKPPVRFAVSQGATPLAVHLLYPQILDDRIPDERTAGIQMGLRVLRACVNCGYAGISFHMGCRRNWMLAKEWGIPVKQIRAEELLAQEVPDRSMEMV